MEGSGCFDYVLLIHLSLPLVLFEIKKLLNVQYLPYLLYTIPKF